jgi:hypothetical protein
LSTQFDFEANLERLVKMYPGYDEGVLKSLLELYGGNVDNVVSSITV